MPCERRAPRSAASARSCATTQDHGGRRAAFLDIVIDEAQRLEQEIDRVLDDRRAA
jgi:hypothetical protein